MNLLKRLFCDHKYVYYAMEPASDTLFISKIAHDLVTYKFVCKKCGKVISIDQYSLEGQLRSAHREEKRREALGESIDSNVEEIEIMPYHGISTQYKGKYVASVLEKYKKRGIDLQQLPKGCWQVELADGNDGKK